MRLVGLAGALAFSLAVWLAVGELGLELFKQVIQ